MEISGITYIVVAGEFSQRALELARALNGRLIIGMEGLRFPIHHGYRKSDIVVLPKADLTVSLDAVLERLKNAPKGEYVAKEYLVNLREYKGIKH